MEKLNLIKFDISYNVLKKPAILVYLFVFPITIFALLGCLMASKFTEGISSYDYFGITIMIYFQLTMGTMASNMIMEEEVKLPNMRIAYALEKENFIYLSKIIALIICDAIAIAFYTIFLNIVCHVNFGGCIIFMQLTYLCLGFFSMCLGTFLCIWLKDESMCNNLLGVIQLALCALGGVFFPVDYLGRAGEVLSNISIVKWINYGIGRYVYGHSLIYLASVCGIALLCSLVLLLVTKKIFKIQLFI